jgi:hypothetical protein
MADENIIMIYPFPDKIDQWKESMHDAFEKEFISQAELDVCLEHGGITIDLLAQIHAKIVSYSSFNRIMITAHWMKIKKNIDLSDDDWHKFNF